MAATATDSGGDESLRSKTQQSPLASQRAKTSNTPTEANRKGRMSTYFPLGYKEGFSQWVSTLSRASQMRLNYHTVGKCTSCHGRT